MRRIEDRIIAALAGKKTIRLSERDLVYREQPDGHAESGMIYKLWYTNICIQYPDGRREKLITEKNPWYHSQTTQSRLRALGLK